MNNPTLTFFQRAGWIGTYPVAAYTTIGRATQGSTCSIQLRAPMVSRLHGIITLQEGCYQYQDQNSTNGTYHNRKRIGVNTTSGVETVTLQDGDILGFDVVQEGVQHPDRIYGVFSTTLTPDQAWQEYPLHAVQVVQIGSAAESDIVLQDAVSSAQHAIFFRSENGWLIKDQSSATGTFLNAKRLTAPRYLKELDIVQIADSYFVFLSDRILCSSGRIQSPASCTIIPKQQEPRTVASVPVSEPIVQTASEPVPEPAPTIAAAVPSVTPILPQEPVTPPVFHTERTPVASDAALHVHIQERTATQHFKKVKLLQNIDLTIRGGQMVLILGGSGAGKTTLIHAITGYEKATGTITYNDIDIYEEYDQMKYEIGFVTQQDLLRESDTVYATLSNAAEMKLPRTYSYEKREQKITEVLEEFGLASEREKLVSKLSGGQKKRLSIAVEYISSPSLFVLDEPDSGLDDAMGRGLMENLRRIADRGKIVMVITHSPERAMDLFDRVIVLAKSRKTQCGHLAFFGSIPEAFAFFETQSFVGILKRINRPDENGEGLSDYFIEKYAEEKGEQL